MSKWEYAVITTQSGPPGPRGGFYTTVVATINEKDVTEKEVNDGEWYEGEQLHDYLNRAGQEGWRVVGSLESAVILERELS